MKFAMFFMAEYANMITVGCVATLLFLRRLDEPLRQPAAGTPTASVSRRCFPLFWFVLKVFAFLLSLHLGARHASTFPLRPTDGLRLEVPAAARHRQHHRHQLCRWRCDDQLADADLQCTFRSHVCSTAFTSDSVNDSTEHATSHFSSSLARCAWRERINLLLQRHPINSALSLIVVMTSLAVLYLLAGRGVPRRRAGHRLFRRHHGAVHLRHHAAERGRRRAHTRQPRRLPRRRSGSRGHLAGPAELRLPLRRRPLGPATASADCTRSHNLADLSRVLFRDLLLPFEVTSVLILIAILGAVVLARKEEH